MSNVLVFMNVNVVGSIAGDTRPCAGPSLWGVTLPTVTGRESMADDIQDPAAQGEPRELQKLLLRSSRVVDVPSFIKPDASGALAFRIFSRFARNEVARL